MTRRVVRSQIQQEENIHKKTNILIFTLFSALGWSFASLVLLSLLLIFSEASAKVAIPTTSMAVFAAFAAVVLGIRAQILHGRLKRLRS